MVKQAVMMTMMEGTDFNKNKMCNTIHNCPDTHLTAAGPQTCRKVYLEGREQRLFQT